MLVSLTFHTASLKKMAFLLLLLTDWSELESLGMEMNLETRTREFSVTQIHTHSHTYSVSCVLIIGWLKAGTKQILQLKRNREGKGEKKKKMKTR